mmetsp:Transcript_54685/g.127539  ORF Transcript_54685/g.127539 Transcript_54685/m.127539 type:complete len:387 (+) Transcript_54685:40-1200(+)
MVKYNEFDADFLDVSKPYLASPAPAPKRTFWCTWWPGSKLRKPLNQNPKQEIKPVLPHGGTRKQHVVAVEEEEEEEEEDEEEEEEEEFEQDPELQLANPEMLRELDGLKEAVSGLQSELSTLRKDNGVLRSALCAHTGGTLPVEAPFSSMAFATSPHPPADMDTSTTKPRESNEDVGKDDLTDALAGHSCPERTGSWCQPWLSDCSCGSIVAGSRNAGHAMRKSWNVCSPPSSPLARSAGDSTSVGGSNMSASSSTAASPERPAREPPMRSLRELPSTPVHTIGSGTIPFPRSSNQMWDQIRLNSQQTVTRPASLTLKTPGGWEAETDEESDCPEAPPESDVEDPPSPPSAPAAFWSDTGSQASVDFLAQPLQLPFANVALQYDHR